MWLPWIDGDDFDSCFFYLSLFLFGFSGDGGFFGSNVRQSDMVQSETIIQFPRNSHSPMIIPRREFRTPRLRCQMISIPSRTPFLFSFGLCFFGKGGAGMNGILFTTTLSLPMRLFF